MKRGKISTGVDVQESTDFFFYFNCYFKVIEYLDSRDMEFKNYTAFLSLCLQGKQVIFKVIFLKTHGMLINVFLKI